MPRKKKEEIVNALGEVGLDSLNSLHDMESDDIVLNELGAEEAKAAREVLDEMDERKKINASKREKKDLYTHDTYAGMDDDEDDDLIMEEQLRYENFQKLNMSLISGSILRGEVVKAMKRNKDPENPDMPTAIVKMENDDYFTIKIPFTDFIAKDNLPKTIYGDTPADKLNYMDLLINMRTGSLVYFIVQKIDEQTGEVVASRTNAMKRIIRDKWFSRDREGRFDVAWLGREVKGRVMAVNRYSMIVEAMGIEKTLMTDNVSYQRYTDLRTAPLRMSRDEVTGTPVLRPYREGDSVMLRITGLRRTFQDATGAVIEDKDVGARRDVRPLGIAVKLSVKETSQNPDIKYFKNFSVGEKVKAQITHVDENGIFCKLAGLRGARIMFSPDNNDIPRVNSFCLVRITKMKEENYQINCEIVQSYR